MSRWQPTTPATREAAAWWLEEVRAALPVGTPVRDVEGVVRRQAARVSHVVLSVACGLVGVPNMGADVPTGGVLISRLVSAEVHRLAVAERDR